MAPVINTWTCSQTGTENSGAKINRNAIAELGKAGMGFKIIR
jgi:hypothetical protein